MLAQSRDKFATFGLHLQISIRLTPHTRTHQHVYKNGIRFEKETVRDMKKRVESHT